MSVGRTAVGSSCWGTSGAVVVGNVCLKVLAAWTAKQEEEDRCGLLWVASAVWLGKVRKSGKIQRVGGASGPARGNAFFRPNPGTSSG